MSANACDDVDRVASPPAAYDGPVRPRRVSVHLPPEAMLHTFTDDCTSKYELGCIQIDSAKTRLAATNGRIAVVCRLPELADLPIVSPVLLQGRMFESADLLRKASGGELFLVYDTTMANGPAWSIECRETIQSNRVIWTRGQEAVDGRYPNIDALLPQDPARSHRVLLSPKLLDGIVSHVNRMHTATSLWIECNPERAADPIRLRPSNSADDAPDCEYRLMPMSVESTPNPAAEAVPVAKDPGDYLKWQAPIGRGNNYPLPDGTVIELDTSGNGRCFAKIDSVDQWKDCSNARLVDGGAWVGVSAASQWRVKLWPLVFQPALENKPATEREADAHRLWLCDSVGSYEVEITGSLIELVEFITAMSPRPTKWVITDMSDKPVCSNKVPKKFVEQALDA